MVMSDFDLNNTEATTFKLQPVLAFAKPGDQGGKSTHLQPFGARKNGNSCWKKGALCMSAEHGIASPCIGLLFVRASQIMHSLTALKPEVGGVLHYQSNENDTFCSRH